MPKNNIYEKLKETQTSREEIYDGDIIQFVKDIVKLLNGTIARREVALHNGAVCIVALTDDNEIIMERQYRYPFDDVIWEIPAGKLDKNESDPLDAAKRELKEETGYTAKNYRFIGEYYGSPAILREKIYMYLATGLKEGEQKLDEDEFLDVVKIPFSEAVKMIADNEIPDGKTQTAILKAKLILGL